MKGKWSSSRVDLGYTNLFCIPEVTSVFISPCDSVLGDSLVFHQESRGSLRVWLRTQNCSACNAGESSLICLERGLSHGICRVAAETWGIFSSYSRDGDSNLHLVQRSPDSCHVMTDTSGIQTRLGRIIQTLLDMMWETMHTFQVSTEILGFLSIFKKSQALSPFEALNSTSLLRCQGMQVPCPDEAGN